MSQELSKSTIGLRAQEFHEGLKEFASFAPKEMHMHATILIGKVASLATHLKGLNYVEDYKALVGLSSQLGISNIELGPILRELQEIDFATVVEAGSQIKRVDLRIPELRNGYETLGERWTQLNPGEIEHAAIKVLDDVASFPHKETEVKSKLGLDDKTFDIVLAIATTGALVDKYEYKSEETILYSPLTVEEKPDALLTLAQKFPEDHIVSALIEVKSRQGVPLELLKSSNFDFITQAVRLGVLCPVQITAAIPERTFLFTPRGGLRKEERVILEKARAILACVRCGEHYAKVKKIIYPRRILETLRDNKRFRYSRPDFPEQYGLLVTKQIGFIEPDKGRPSFYNFFLYDTPENIRALDIAIDLLETGQSPISKLEVDAREFLSVSGSFRGTLPSRTKMVKGTTLSKDMTRDIITEISKLARGVIR